MTKRMLKDALLELLEHNDLTSISVTEICETADVHRSTFYKYYADPADLLREAEQDFLDRIPVPPEPLDPQSQEQLLQSTTTFFDYVRENGKAFRILFGESCDNRFSARLVEYLCMQPIPLPAGRDDPSGRFVQLYIANGTVGMLREWVQSDFPVSSRQIAEMMYFLSRKVSS